jgi:aryl carrier-like protein
VVAREGGVDASVLRTFLRERLPEHMVPAAFVPLPALPLSAHGKVERRALPAPGEAHLGSGQPYVEPQGELERTLASIWCEVLGLQRVGRHERFFDVGGNSMSIVRVQARVREALGLKVSLPELFQHPTLGALAEHLSSRESGPKLETSQERGGSRRDLMAKQRQSRTGRGKKGNES